MDGSLVQDDFPFRKPMCFFRFQCMGPVYMDPELVVCVISQLKLQATEMAVLPRWWFRRSKLSLIQSLKRRFPAGGGWVGGWLGGWGQFPISESTETTEASAKTPKLSIWTHKKVGGSLQNAGKVSLQNARSGSLQNAIKKRKRITMVFDTSSIYCTCFSVSDGCSGCSVDVTGLDRAHMSHATGELSVNVHACSKARTCNGFWHMRGWGVLTSLNSHTFLLLRKMWGWSGSGV